MVMLVLVHMRIGHRARIAVCDPHMSSRFVEGEYVCTLTLMKRESATSEGILVSTRSVGMFRGTYKFDETS